jgi:hypothetical protein
MVAFLAVVLESVLFEYANEGLVVDGTNGGHAVISGSS